MRADAAMATGFGWVPPLAVVDALGGKTEFMKLAQQRLSSELLARIKLKDTLKDLPDGSHYDFRSYFKGKQ